LNAGQVFGTRVAENVAASGIAACAAQTDITDVASKAVAHVAAVLQPESQLEFRTVREAIQARMSDNAGLICSAHDVAAARVEARALCADIRQKGLCYDRPGEIARTLQWQQMAIASEAVLAALDHYIRCGGGSRGARTICDPNGDAVPETRTGPLSDFRFRTETSDDQEKQILVRLVNGNIHISERPNRVFDESAKSFFERDWPAWLTGAVFDLKTEANSEC
jgi:hypothetical protein